MPLKKTKEILPDKECIKASVIEWILFRFGPFFKVTAEILQLTRIIHPGIR